MASALEQLVIGIDIGGTGTKFGIVDRHGNVLFSSEISTKKHSTVESFIDDLITKNDFLLISFRNWQNRHDFCDMDEYTGRD